jgi:DNA-directed RNA polymerase subunit RPC12/RpoP
MKPIKFFVYSAGGILLAAALIRFLIAVGNAPVLTLPEPVLGVPLRYAVLLVGGIDLAVALICLFGKQVNLQLGCLAWLATNFIVYQVGLFSMHYNPQATSIGSLTDPLHLSRGTTGVIMGFLPLYLVLGSYWVCLMFWFSKDARIARLTATQQRDTAEGLLKMFCPACGGHVKFATQNTGQQITCPHCQSAITLCKPDETLKMTCVLCSEHIEFPAHALGQKIPCPHCTKVITLLKPA